MNETIREKAEALLQEKLSIEDVLEDNKIPRILHELRVHQIELELQNEELRRTQSELQNTQKKYFDLYNFAPVGYFTFDEHGVMVGVNLTAAKLLNRDRNQLQNKPFLVYLDTSTRPIFFEHLDMVFETKKRQSCELTLQRSNNDKVYLYVDSIAAKEGGKWYCRSIMTDITTLRKTKIELASEKERLRVTLHSIADGVIATDIKGQIILINRMAEKITGWSQREAEGRALSDVYDIADEPIDKISVNPVYHVLQTGGNIDTHNETILTTKDGRQCLTANSGAPIRDAKSNIVGAVLVFRDVTKQKKMEEELLKTQKLESMGILAGGIAHDFNNILASILGNVSLAKMKTTQDSPIYENLSRAESASIQASDLTQQLLTFAKGGSPIKETKALNKLITTSVNFTVRGSNVLPRIKVADNLWSVEIDGGQINQVLNNLIINAYQAMPAGGVVTVTAENIELSGQDAVPLTAGKYVKIIVQDQGEGIPKKYLSKIFDPYFSTKEAGNGLGLASAYSIIQNHAGYLQVSSEEGIGSVFTFYLPASIKEALPSNEVGESVPLTGEGHILVMDDEEMIRDFLQTLLIELGYRVSLAKNGQEAIDLYQQVKESSQPFDAVIMDLTIPGGMGGKETIQTLLKIDPQIKAIVSSGYSNDPVMSDYKRYGFKGMVPKPYDVRKISECLQATLKI